MPHQSFSDKDDLKKRFSKNIKIGRVMVWWGVKPMMINFCKAYPFPQVSVLLFILFFKSSWRQISSAAFNSVRLPAGTTFALPSVWFLFYEYSTRLDIYCIMHVKTSTIYFVFVFNSIQFTLIQYLALPLVSGTPSVWFSCSSCKEILTLTLCTCRRDGRFIHINYKITWWIRSWLVL